MITSTSDDKIVRPLCKKEDVYNTIIYASVFRIKHLLKTSAKSDSIFTNPDYLLSKDEVNSIDSLK